MLLNEYLSTQLKNITRYGQIMSDSEHYPNKKAIEKSIKMTSATLKPLYNIINKTLLNLDTINFNQIRLNVIQATEEITTIKDHLDNSDNVPKS